MALPRIKAPVRPLRGTTGMNILRCPQGCGTIRSRLCTGRDGGVRGRNPRRCHAGYVHGHRRRPPCAVGTPPDTRRARGSHLGARSGTAGGGGPGCGPATGDPPMTTRDERAEQIQRSVQAREAAQWLVQSARAAVRRADEDRARARSARERAEHTRERDPRVPPRAGVRAPAGSGPAAGWCPPLSHTAEHEPLTSARPRTSRLGERTAAPAPWRAANHPPSRRRSA